MALSELMLLLASSTRRFSLVFVGSNPKRAMCSHHELRLNEPETIALALSRSRPGATGESRPSAASAQGHQAKQGGTSQKPKGWERR